MPGPNLHIMYVQGPGVSLMHASGGKFSPQHCLFYAINAFLSPYLDPFAEWLTSSVFRFGAGLGSLAMEFVHHPFYYVLLLGLPMTAFYVWLSPVLLRKGVLDTGTGVGLSREQCLLLVAARSLTHFFLDHLFKVVDRTNLTKIEFLVWIFCFAVMFLILMDFDEGICDSES